MDTPGSLSIAPRPCREIDGPALWETNVYGPLGNRQIFVKTGGYVEHFHKKKNNRRSVRADRPLEHETELELLALRVRHELDLEHAEQRDCLLHWLLARPVRLPFDRELADAVVLVVLQLFQGQFLALNARIKTDGTR